MPTMRCVLLIMAMATNGVMAAVQRSRGDLLECPVARPSLSVSIHSPIDGRVVVGCASERLRDRSVWGTRERMCLSSQTRTHARAHAHAHTHSHTHARTRTRARTLTLTLTHTHTHTHTPCRPSPTRSRPKHRMTILVLKPHADPGLHQPERG
jgi:hypothetical protein